MRRTITGLRASALACWALFGWAIAAEVELLPRFSDAAWLRWQVCLLTGLVLTVTRERLGELRCRCCGSEQVLVRGLATRSHELLCRRCLHWNPITEPAPEVLQE